MHGHTGWGGVNEAVGSLQRTLNIGGGRDASGKARFQPTSQRGGSVVHAVDDIESLRTHLKGGIGGGRTGASGAELHDPVKRRARQASANALTKPPPVGVVANSPCVAEDDSIDRTEGVCAFREFGQVCDDALLAGVSDVQAGKTETFGGIDERRHCGGPVRDGVEVQELIDAPDTVRFGLPFMHGRTARCMNAGTDKTEQQSRAGNEGQTLWIIRSARQGLPKALSRIPVRPIQPSLSRETGQLADWRSTYALRATVDNLRVACQP